MIKFDKLVIISGDKYSIRTDDITDLKFIFNKLTDVNTTVVLVLSYGIDTYTVDLGRLILENIYLLDVPNIAELIKKLTPEYIYAYETTVFNNPQNIRSFMSCDLPGDVVLSPCNIVTGERTDISNDPGHSDLEIYCENVDLTNMIPVIGDRLTKCIWGNGRIFMKDRANLANYAEEVTFISFAGMNITVKKLADVANDEWKLPSNTSAILVLNGSMFFDVPYIFKVDIYDKLTLNIPFIMSLFTKHGFTDIEALIDDMDSFIILVHSNRIIVRDVLMIPMNEDPNIPAFKYFESCVQSKHVDYVCLDNATQSVHGITTVDDQLRDVFNLNQSDEHHVYVYGGSGDMRLVQFAVF